MKVMLINPRVPVFLRVPSIPLGLISIGSYLRAHGDEVFFIDRMMEKVNIEQAIKDFNPQVVGISCHSYLSSLDAKNLTEIIHRISDALVVWGGHAPSTLAEVSLKDGKPDCISLGEGEITIYELVRAVENGTELSMIPGLAYLNESGECVYTAQRPVADMYTFPEMDWSFVQPEKYFTTFFHCNKMLYLHASKGCPANCTFCANEVFHQRRHRCRDPKHVMHDLEYFVGKCGANGIYFSDEQFVPNRRVREELLNMIIDSGLDFVWGCQIRLGVLNEKDLDLMYKAGCRWILFGIESGDPQMIDAIKKNIDLSLAKPTVEHCEKLGMTVQVSFIIGFPGETCEQMQKSIDMALSLNASLPQLNILIPAPGSEIYDDLVRNNPDFHAPRTIKEIAKLENKMMDIVSINVSEIPTIDLYVAHYYLQWRAFSSKNSVNSDSFGILKKLAEDTFNRIFKHGLRGFLFGTFYSVRQFVLVFFFSHFFPRVLKKYHLK